MVVVAMITGNPLWLPLRVAELVPQQGHEGVGVGAGV